MKIKVLGTVITPLLEEFAKKKKSSLVEKDRYIRPSMISGCSRMIVYYLRGEPFEERETPQDLRVLETGHCLHWRIQRQLVESGLAKEDSVEVLVENDELWLRGHCDAIIEINNEKYVFEFKTINSWSFSKLIDIPDSYKDQVTLYMYCLKIPRSIFLFENKDTQEWREFIYLLEESRLDSLLAKIKKIQHFVENNLLPERECSSENHGVRKRCPFVKLCFRELSK